MKRRDAQRNAYAAWLAQVVPDLGEMISDMECEYRSECAMFGDAGPGAGLRLREIKRNYRDLSAQAERLGKPRELRGLHDAHVRAQRVAFDECARFWDDVPF